MRRSSARRGCWSRIDFRVSLNPRVTTVIAIVLQTPKDQQSSVLLTSQDLAAELKRSGHHVTIVTPG